MQAMVVAPHVPQPDCASATTSGGNGGGGGGGGSGGHGLLADLSSLTTAPSADLRGLLTDLSLWKRQAATKTDKFSRRHPQFNYGYDCTPGSDKEREIRMMCERHLESKMKKMEQEYMKSKGPSTTLVAATASDRVATVGPTSFPAPLPLPTPVLATASDAKNRSCVGNGMPPLPGIEQIKRKKRRVIPSEWSDIGDNCSCRMMPANRLDTMYDVGAIQGSSGATGPCLNLPRDAALNCSNTSAQYPSHQGAYGAVARENTLRLNSTENLNRFATELNLPRHVLEEIFQSATPNSFDASVIDAAASTYLSDLDNQCNASSVNADLRSQQACAYIANSTAGCSALLPSYAYEGPGPVASRRCNTLSADMFYHSNGCSSGEALGGGPRRRDGVAEQNLELVTSRPSLFESQFCSSTTNHGPLIPPVSVGQMCFKKEELDNVEEAGRHPYFSDHAMGSCFAGDIGTVAAGPSVSAVASKMVVDVNCRYTMTEYRTNTNSVPSPLFASHCGNSCCTIPEQRAYFPYQRDSGGYFGPTQKPANPYVGPCGSLGPAIRLPFSDAPARQAPIPCYKPEEAVSVGSFTPPYQCFDGQPMQQRPCQYSSAAMGDVSSMSRYSLN